MNFMHPHMFWLALLLPFFLWLPLRRRQQQSLSLPSLKLLDPKKLQRGFDWGRFIPTLLSTLAFLLFIIALARPRHGKEISKSFSEGIDIMFSLDTSGSMKYYDQKGNIRTSRDIIKAIKDETAIRRIDEARDAIADFIKKRPQDRIGLTVFAAAAFNQCPPTDDHEFLLKRLKDSEPEMLGPEYGRATNISAAISGGVKRLKDTKTKRKIIILVTDGAHTHETELPPLNAAEAAKNLNTTIYTIAIGADKAWAIVDYPGGRRGLEMVNGQFDKQLLKDIAAKTDGLHFSTQDDSLTQVLEEINKIETQKVERVRLVKYKENWQNWFYAALGLLLLSLLLQNTLYARYP